MMMKRRSLAAFAQLMVMIMKKLLIMMLMVLMALMAHFPNGHELHDCNM